MKLVIAVRTQLEEPVEIEEVPIAREDFVDSIRSHFLSLGWDEDDADTAAGECLTGDTIAACRSSGR